MNYIFHLIKFWLKHKYQFHKHKLQPWFAFPDILYIYSIWDWQSWLERGNKFTWIQSNKGVYSPYYKFVGIQLTLWKSLLYTYNLRKCKRNTKEYQWIPQITFILFIWFSFGMYGCHGWQLCPGEYCFASTGCCPIYHHDAAIPIFMVHLLGSMDKTLSCLMEIC